MALRQGDRAAGAMGTCSVVDETEHDEELCPGAEPLIHGVRVQGGVFTQALVEAGERVVAEEGVVFRQHAALLGVEEEDEAEDDSEEPSIDVVAVAVLGERLAKQFAAGGVVGGLEPPDELVEGVHHLFREPFAHLVLVLAAVLEEGGEPLGARQREEALLGEGGGGGRSRGGRPAVRLMSATRKSIQPELSPRGAEMRRSATPLKSRPAGTPVPRSRRSARPWAEASRREPVPTGYRRVKVLPGVEHLDEELPRRLTVALVALADREVGAEGLAVVREGNLQLGRNRSLCRAGEPAGRGSPSRGRWRRTPGSRRCMAPRRVRGRARARGCSRRVGSCPSASCRFRMASRLRERRGGYHQAVRLDVAEPFEVGAGVGVGGGHGRRVVYPARHRARSPRSRRCVAVTLLCTAVV